MEFFHHICGLDFLGWAERKWCFNMLRSQQVKLYMMLLFLHQLYTTFIHSPGERSVLSLKRQTEEIKHEDVTSQTPTSTCSCSRKHLSLFKCVSNMCPWHRSFLSVSEKTTVCIVTVRAREVHLTPSTHTNTHSFMVKSWYCCVRCDPLSLSLGLIKQTHTHSVG